MLNPNGTWGYLYVQNGAPLIEQLSCEFFELKPFNPKAAKQGVKQLKRYSNKISNWRIARLEFY